MYLSQEKSGSNRDHQLDIPQEFEVVGIDMRFIEHRLADYP
jgi:hypothetical protein